MRAASEEGGGEGERAKWAQRAPNFSQINLCSNTRRLCAADVILRSSQCARDARRDSPINRYYTGNKI